MNRYCKCIYISGNMSIYIYSFFTNQCSMIPVFSAVVAVKQKYISLCSKKIPTKKVNLF